MSPKVRGSESGEDEDEEGQEGVEESDLFGEPSDDDYDRIKFFAGLEKLPKAFAPYGDFSRELLKGRRAAFAVRFSGGDPKTGAYEPDAFTERVMRAARLNRWVANSLFRGVGFPGVTATLPGSLIAHFTVASGETRLKPGKGHEAEYPSIYGARAVGRLLAYTGDRDALVSAVKPLGKRAVKTLLGALEDSVHDQVTVNWLTHEGQYSALTPVRAEKGVEALNLVPPMIVRAPVTIVGAVNRPDWQKQIIRLQPLRGGPMLLHYESGMEAQIGDAWRKYVVAQMVVEEPENPSLPRAPQRRRLLTRIESIYDSADDIPEWLLP